MSKKVKSNEEIQIYLDSINREEEPEEPNMDESAIPSSSGLKSKQLVKPNAKYKNLNENFVSDTAAEIDDRTQNDDGDMVRVNILNSGEIVNIKQEAEDRTILTANNEVRISKRAKKQSLKVIENMEVNYQEIGDDQYFDFNDTCDDKSKDDDPPIIHPIVIVNAEYSNEGNPDESKEKPAYIFKCPSCPFTAVKKYVLSRHVRSHSDDKSFTCPMCSRKFKTNFILTSHINTHLGKKPFVCTNCPKAFTTKGELTRHNRYKHTGEKPHKCTECDYATVEMSKLRRHMRSHTGERPYQCPHCTYASPDTFKLKRHIRTHTGEKPYVCDICHARFTQSNSLKSHRLIHNVGEKPVFKCSYCPTTCGRKRDLFTHVLILHNTDKPITCKKCGKELPDRYNYKLHARTHQGEKCFRCRFCPYASTLEAHVKSHMLIHTDEKPFTCDICDLSFRQNQLLKRHINLYHNKNYVKPQPKAKENSCPKCKRCYIHKGNLMRHMATHDPDSKLQEEKQKLLLGRKTKVFVHGSLSGQEADLYDKIKKFNEGYEEMHEPDETIDDPDDIYDNDEYMNSGDYDEAELEDDKPITFEIEDVNQCDNDNLSLKTKVTVKRENKDKHCVAVQDEDGTEYLVYTVTDDEETNS